MVKITICVYVMTLLLQYICLSYIVHVFFSQNESGTLLDVKSVLITPTLLHTYDIE